MATRLQNDDNWQAAARLWEQLDGLLHDHAAILVAWGNALFEAGQKDLAGEKFQRAVHVDPRHVWGWVDLARYYIDRRKFHEALAAAQRATACTPPESMAWVNLACTFCALERYQEGFQAAQRALALDDRNPFAMYYAGVCLGELGRVQEANQQFQRLLRVAPDHNLAPSAREILDSLK
jgi:tetratricopeptide (TPR) repeat protein